jgi:hypothetical protein
LAPATPPEPTRSSGRPRPGTIRLPASIDRRDVPELVARCMEAAAADEPLTADCRALLEPKLAAIETLARLALASARDGRRFRLEHASPSLLELVRLCGLEGSLEGERGAG